MEAFQLLSCLVNAWIVSDLVLSIQQREVVYISVSFHQNIALKLKAMRALGLNVSKRPDTFIKEHDTNEKLREAIEPKLPDNVKFTSWKKVVENKTGIVERCS
jgi:hypothetical protein